MDDKYIPIYVGSPKEDCICEVAVRYFDGDKEITTYKYVAYRDGIWIDSNDETVNNIYKWRIIG